MGVNDKWIEEFCKEINKKPFIDYIGSEVLKPGTELKVYKDAIYEGYLDACRTLKKTEKRIQKDDEKLDHIAGIMKHYIEDDGDCKFENTHKALCDEVMEKYEMTYGHAQKIINMAFKYLFCLTKDLKEGEKNQIQQKFDKCHIPLDGTMLEWYVRNVGSKIDGFKKGKIKSWSCLEYGPDDEDEDGSYTYCYFVKHISRFCEDNKITPLQVDFENWKLLQLKMAAENLIFSMNNSLNRDEIRNEKLSDNLKRIEGLIKSYK